MQDYKDLIVWKKSMDLAEAIYKLCRSLPKEETYVMSDQLRRAAISVPSNIAEGYGRRSSKEYVRFLNISRGSNNEIETQLLLCVRLGYFDKEDISSILELIDETSRMLTGLIRKVSEE